MIDLDALRADTSGEALAEFVRLVREHGHGSRNGRADKGPYTSPGGFGPSPFGDIDKTIAENTRHNAVHKLASALRGRGGWREEDAVAYFDAVVFPELDQSAGDPPHPYTREEMLGDIADVFRRYPDGNSDDGNPQSSDRQQINPFDQLVRGGGFIHDNPDETEAVWGAGTEVLMSSGEPTYLFGPEGVGKTTLAAQIVRARIGLADQVLDWAVTCDGKPVLYLAMDRPAQISRALKRLFADDERALLNQQLAFWRGPLPKLVEDDPEMLVRLAEHVGTGLVVIDSVKDLTATIDKPESAAYVNRAFQACVSRGIEVLALHHPRKSNAQNKEPNGLDDMYGGRWLAAGAGSVLCLTGKAGDPIVKMTHLKQPVEEVGPVTIIHDHHLGVSRVERGRGLLDIVLGRAGGATVGDAARLLYGTDKPSRAQIEKGRRKLDQLVESGKLVSEQFMPPAGGKPSKRYRRPSEAA